MMNVVTWTTVSGPFQLRNSDSKCRAAWRGRLEAGKPASVGQRSCGE